jgi:Zn-dependent peptidase ImmA (M78 family)
MDPDEAASWGSFQIWVGGKNLCLHTEEDEDVKSVHWYLLPLIEWFARHWDALLHEERLPNTNDAETAWTALQGTVWPPAAVECQEERSQVWESDWWQWWQRHSLLAAREGGLFPDIVIRRFRDSVEVSWGGIALEGMPEHYNFAYSEGYLRVDPQMIAQALFQTMNEAADYLLARSPDSQRLAELHETIMALRNESSDRRLRWLAGLGGVSENQRESGWDRVKNLLADSQDRFQRLFDVEQDGLVITGSCHAALMFGSVDPNVSEQDVLRLAGFMVDLSGDGTESESLRSIVLSERPDFPVILSPWHQGYRLAERFRRNLSPSLSTDEPLDVVSLLNEYGITRREIELSDSNIRGVAVAGSGFSPGILINTRYGANQYQSGIRFSLVHELCHLVYDRSHGQKLAIASGPWAPIEIEKRANAFAAMFLMPPALIQHLLQGRGLTLSSNEDVIQLAQILHTSRTALVWHLTNLGFIGRTDLERLDLENEPPMTRPNEPCDAI